LTALERDPRQRWSSAAAMRSRVQAVSSHLGETADNARVVEWVRWALEQKTARKVQLTPMLAMPVVKTPSPEQVIGLPPAPAVPTTKSLRNVIVVFGILLLVLVVVAVVR